MNDRRPSSRTSPRTWPRTSRMSRLRFTSVVLLVIVAITPVALLGSGLRAGFAEEPDSAVSKPPRPLRATAERVTAAKRLRKVYGGDPAAWPAPDVDAGVAWREIGLLPEVKHPESNPVSTAKVTLGRMLFYDVRLSASGKIACVSCHDPSLGWADGRVISQPLGKPPGRNTPTIRNAAFQSFLFWDGRAASLEQQVDEALTNPTEMAASRDQVIGLLGRSSGYRELFAESFPGRPIGFAEVVDAVACFERTIVGGRSRFDTFLQGDTAAVSDRELLGLDLFRREARCMNCHHGPTFSDGRFHGLGLSRYGRSNEDPGRFAVTGDAQDSGRFRTPTLRDVTRTTPLTHTGQFSLAGVLNMYNAGMVTLKRHDYQQKTAMFPVKSPHLKPLDLNRQDLADLAAFLGTLEEPQHLVPPPPLPEIEDAAVTVAR